MAYNLRNGEHRQKAAAEYLGLTERQFSRFTNRIGLDPDKRIRFSSRGEYNVWSVGTLERIKSSEEYKQLFERKERKAQRAPVVIELLPAIFAVSHAAHRARDAAQSHYSGSRHGLARHGRETKETLYALKDRGIAEAFRQGLLTYDGLHGGLAVYSGGGYCFHSRLVPSGFDAEAADDDDGQRHFSDARPREAREPRLMDAKHTLEQCAAPSGFRMLDLPRFSQSPRPDRHIGDNDDDDDDDDEESGEPPLP